MLQVTVDGRSVAASDVQYSAADPGGFEASSFTLDDPKFNVYGGSDVRIFEGLETAWHGRIEDPGFLLEQGKAKYQVNAVGYGAELKDNQGSMVYIDRDLNSWGPASAARQLTLIAAGLHVQNSPEVLTNTNSGSPLLRLSWTGSTIAGVEPIVEAYYDAGYGNGIREIRADYVWGQSTNTSGDANWQSFIGLALNDELGSVQTTSANGVTAASISQTGTISNLRYAVILFYYAAQLLGSADGKLFNIDYSNVRVIGDHELVLVGPSASSQGFYLSDIVQDIIRRSGVNFDTRIDFNNYIVSNLVYRDRVDFETMVEDMRKLSGWHWGVWEPVGFSNRPTFHFNPPSKEYTSVSANDCENLDLTSSYSATYDVAVVSYSDVLGIKKYATYSLPGLNSTGHHTLSLDIGVSTAAAATAIASYALLSSRQASSGSGSCLLPLQTSDGKYSHLLRPGRDNIAIRDLPSGHLSLFESNNVFSIKRISVTTSGGIPRASVEFDKGADLIEVLQAQLAQGAARIGF